MVSPLFYLPRCHFRTTAFTFIPAALNLAQRIAPQTTLHSRGFCSTSGSDEPVADVAIIGGGMVGAALAALLAANPLTRTLRILLVDQQAQSFTWKPPGVPELRVSTVTPATIRCLERAGAWQLVERHSASFESMQVWDSAGPGCIRWHAQDVGRPSMGAVAENSLLQAALLGAIKGHDKVAGSQTLDAVPTSALAGAPLNPGVTCVWPAALKELQLPPSGPQQPVEGEKLQGEGVQGDQGQSQAPAAGSSLAQLRFEDGASVCARLVVAADGAMSRVRALAGLRTWGWSYNQRGLVATVRLKGGCTGTAWQRFLPTGPIAVLPVRDGLANIVWSTTPAMAAQLEKTTPAAFARAVNQALTSSPSSPAWLPAGPWVDAMNGSGLAVLAKTALEQVSQQGGREQYQAPPTVEAWVGHAPCSFPLQLKQSGRYVRPRLALVGDAAHAVHPLAGQGVNLGFGDAEVLADALARAVECGTDVGDVMMLQDDYERPRQRAVLAMTSALDGLQKVFSLQATPLAAARNLGLGLLNITPPVKNEIMKFAMGM